MNTKPWHYAVQSIYEQVSTFVRALTVQFCCTLITGLTVKFNCILDLPILLLPSRG